MDTNTGWSTFKLCGDYKSDLRTVYQAWATADGLEKWFLRKADFFTVPMRKRASSEAIQKDDTYTWFWHGYDNDVTEKGVILEANGKDLISFTFTGGSIVIVRLTTSNGLTIVEISQNNIPPNNDPDKNLLVQCQIGWTFYLTNLKSVLEGGKDLRNKRVELHSCFK